MRKSELQLFQHQLIQNDLSAIITHQQEARSCSALFQKRLINWDIIRAHFRIRKQLQKLLRIHMIHGPEIDVVPDPRHYKCSGQRIRILPDLVTQFFLHSKNQIVILFLDLSIIRSSPEVFHMNLLEQINHVWTGICLLPLIQQFPDLRQIIGILRLPRLLVIQAVGAAFRNTHKSLPFLI